METLALVQFPHTMEVLQRYATEFIELYKLSLVANNRPASGRLSNSLSYQISVDDHSFAVDISLMEYWKWIENDTRPHWPPADAIRRWIEVKPVVPYPMSNGKVPTVNQLTFLIQRKIAEEGTTGTHDLQRTNEQLLADMEQSIAHAVTEDVEAYVNAIFIDYLPR